MATISRRQNCQKPNCPGKQITWHIDPQNPDPLTGNHFWSCDYCGTVLPGAPPTGFTSSTPPPIQDPFAEELTDEDLDKMLQGILIEEEEEPECICSGPQLIGIPNPDCEVHKKVKW